MGNALMHSTDYERLGYLGLSLNVYSKSWWEERVDAVTRVVEAVFTEPQQKKEGLPFLESKCASCGSSMLARSIEELVELEQFDITPTLSVY